MILGNPNQNAIAFLKGQGFSESSINGLDSESTLSANTVVASNFNVLMSYNPGNNQEVALVEGALVQLKLQDASSNELSSGARLCLYKKAVNDKWPLIKLASFDYFPYIGQSILNQQNAQNYQAYLLKFQVGAAPNGYNVVRAGWILELWVTNEATTTIVVTGGTSTIAISALRRTIGMVQ